MTADMTADLADPSAPAPPPGELDFARLPLAPHVQANLQRLGYLQMTPIQAATLPLALAGRDLIAQARTGSGKTAAYALPLLANLNPRLFAVQALVLCPTRELAEQVTQEIRRLARAEDSIKVLTLCGGATMRPQIASLEHGAHVVVGTPGRILDHLARQTLTLDALNTLVLDEADRMLDMGFADDIAQVVRQCPRVRQTLLFSATYPEGVMALGAKYMREPQTVKLAERHAAQTIRQRFYEVQEQERLHAVGLLLNHYRPVSTLAFCNTKQQCRDLVAVLQAQGLVALELHGDLDQRDRDQVLVQFAQRSCSVLVATDVAARGLDISQLEAVINVDISPEVEVHTHRIGRVGRMALQAPPENADPAGAGTDAKGGRSAPGPAAPAPGWAFSLASMEEMGRVGRIEAAQGAEVEWHPLSELTGQAGGAAAGPLRPPMATLQMLGGRKEKIRAGDVLGALTKDMGFAGAQIGKISVNEFSTYVAVERGIAAQVLRKLEAGRVKGRAVRVRLLEA
jgi:ATP-independent RNA helicase DbpA